MTWDYIITTNDMGKMRTHELQFSSHIFWFTSDDRLLAAESKRARIDEYSPFHFDFRILPSSLPSSTRRRRTIKGVKQNNDTSNLHRSRTNLRKKRPYFCNLFSNVRAM
jgi:hypothetical protein